MLDTYAAWMDQNAPSTDRNGDMNYMGVLREKYGDVEGDEKKTAENRRIRYDQLKGMTIAGFETTAITLLYSTYVLNEKPEVNDALREAVRSGDDKTVENIFLAITRLFPGIPRLSRVLDEPTTLRTTIDGEDKEIDLPKGAVLSYMVREGNTDPAQWPDDKYDPKEFHHERWEDFRIDGGRLKKPDAYMSFGAMQTSCLGENFARLEFIKFAEWYYKQPFDIVPSQSGSPRINESWIIAEFTEPEVKALLVPRPIEELSPENI